MSDEDEAVPEGMTALYDADVPRADLVGAAANGIPRPLIAKQAEGAAGLLDPAYVRDLIAKSEPPAAEAGNTGTVTMTGSPAALAEVMQRIHGAPVRKSAATAEPDSYAELVKAKYTAEQLRDLAAKGHAMKNPDGSISYPISDDEDLDAAIRAVGRSGADHDKIRRFVMRRAEEMGRKVPDNWASDGSLKKAMSNMDTSAGMPTDDGIDGMDPTVVLAAPDEDAPGDPNDPGSPAWEAIDAATACKWTAILARARSALGVMADREMLEAATADPSDADAACELQDAACAIDYAISLLAPFAVDEQAASDEGAVDLEMVGKALAGFDAAALDTVESLSAVRKAGRVLSSANEAAIRGAVESLQKVLASLPAAPATEEAGQPVAKTANEEPNMAEPTPSADVTEASGQQPAMGTASLEPQPVAGAVVTDVAKTADKPPQVAVYDANGNLVGVVDPADVTMIAAAKAPAANTDDAPDEPAAPTAEAPDAPPTDMTPAPAASVGTPADAVPADDDSVAKAADTTENTEAPHDVLKGSIRELVKAAINEQSARQGELIKSLEDRNKVLEERNETLAKQAAALEERLTKVENQPAVMAIASNGAIPPAHHLRGQDRGARDTALTEGAALRKQLAESDDALEKKAIADRMEQLAITKFGEMQAAARAR